MVTGTVLSPCSDAVVRLGHLLKCKRFLWTVRRGDMLSDGVLFSAFVDMFFQIFNDQLGRRHSHRPRSGFFS